MMIDKPEHTIKQLLLAIEARDTHRRLGNKQEVSTLQQEAMRLYALLENKSLIIEITMTEVMVHKKEEISMDTLFTVYRYLVQNKNRNDEHNPYNIASRTLDAYLDIERELRFYANKIQTSGGLCWEDAQDLTEKMLIGFETGLNQHHGTALLTAIAFAKVYLSPEGIDKLIEACQKEKTRKIQHEEDQENADKEEEKRLWELDSGQLIENQ